MGWVVYKHTAPNKKIYIGITCQNPKIRWRGGKGYSHNGHFTNAIKKYGWKNFKHEILFSELTQEEAEQKEIELIEKYKCNQREYGYNKREGGNSHGRWSEEVKEKIRQAHIGMKYGAEFCAKQSEIKKGNTNRLGQHLSEESKRKIGGANKGKSAGEKNYFYGKHICGKNHPNTYPVAKYSLDGNLLEIKDSAGEYAKELGKHNSTHIIECCKGKRKSAYGYVWKYGEEAM